MPEPRRRAIRRGLRRHGLIRRPGPLLPLLRERALRFSHGNQVELYADGRSGLQAMLEGIEAAQRRIHLETYILRTDATGRRFLDALVKQAMAGVSVRLLYDEVGSWGLDPGPLHQLADAGGDVVPFNPLGRFYPRWAPRRRDHRKILTVDGEVAFTGGLNIGDEYWGTGSDSRGWRDTHVRVRGPVVRDLDAVFLESWFRADGPDLAWDELVAETPPPVGEVRCAVVADGPVYRRRRTRELVTRGLLRAQRRVRLASPYFAPGRRVLDALTEASERGVEVDLILAGARHDHPILRRIARSFVPRLTRCGVRVLEYQGAMMHAKVAQFDEEWAVVGSSNLDRQSLEHTTR